MAQAGQLSVLQQQEVPWTPWSQGQIVLYNYPAETLIKQIPVRRSGSLSQSLLDTGLKLGIICITLYKMVKITPSFFCNLHR